MGIKYIKMSMINYLHYLIAIVTIFLLIPATIVQAEGNIENRVVRIENEDRLIVPSERLKEVWEYLKAQYVDDTAKLDAIKFGLEARASEEIFTDVYYDTPNLKMLNTQAGLRHRRRINLADKDDPKNNQELIQIKVSGGGRPAIERTELKFSVNESVLGQSQGRLPLSKIVEPAELDSLKQELRLVGADLPSLRTTLTLRDYRRRVYITDKRQPFISFSLDDVRVNYLWGEVAFAEIEIELNEVTYTEADDGYRQIMHDAGQQITNDLREHFPFLERDLTPKYNKAFNQLSKQLPWLRLWFIWGGFIITAALVVAIVFFVLWMCIRAHFYKQRRKEF